MTWMWTNSCPPCIMMSEEAEDKLHCEVHHHFRDNTSHVCYLEQKKPRTILKSCFLFYIQNVRYCT